MGIFLFIIDYKLKNKYRNNPAFTSFSNNYLFYYYYYYFRKHIKN